MSKKTLPVPLLKRELSWGSRYLLFQLVFLGPLLSLLLTALGITGNGLVLDTAYFIVNFGSVVWIFRSYLWQSCKHGLAHWGKVLMAAGIGFAVQFVLSLGLDALIHWMNPDFYNVNDAGFVEYSRANFLLTVFGAVILVPLTEETLFRGLVFGALHQRNRFLAYLVCVVFFALIHVMGYIGSTAPSVLLLCFIQYLPAGFALAWAYEFSGSILAPVLIHTAVNAIAIFSMR